ncbi:hypothetical protein EUX98_g3457 [Antrodiella citrinella]|uniref:Uncharacterized protein n=1 Tax=Antrodiella citrinella TaxID=2447956 RepID=A0A4S4MWH8_9APHY|nr:hypothetical protein EUX98_g3457 [Antrodiella citrinella]
MSSPPSASSDKTFEDYLSIPTKSYGSHHDWFPRHDITCGTPLSPTLNHFQYSDVSHSLFLDSSLTSSGSSLSGSSPGLSETEHDASDASSASGSDSNSESDQDQSWSHHNGYALRQISLLPQDAVEDVPYMPPSGCSVPNIPNPFSAPQGDLTDPQKTEEYAAGLRSSRQKADANIAIIFDGESDVDAEGESEIDSDDEDEYVPSPRLQSRERRTFQYAYHSSRSHSPTSPSTHMTRLQYPPTSPQDGLFRRTRPRHEQASAPISVDNMLGSSSTRWKCPHPHCHYVQRNRRMPDFKRHLQTHTRFLEPEKWICCGIPITDASLDVIASSEPTNFDGQTMVGGCWKVFSRRDALKRHLDNRNIPCKGDLNGSWMPGNSLA